MNERFFFGRKKHNEWLVLNLRHCYHNNNGKFFLLLLLKCLTQMSATGNCPMQLLKIKETSLSWMQRTKCELAQI